MIFVHEALGQRQQGLPPGFDPEFFMRAFQKKMDEEYCPSGVDKCECLNAPGMNVSFCIHFQT